MIITAVYLHGIMFMAVEFSVWTTALCFIMDVVIASCVGD
jgi:hypothetical protein